MFYEVLERLCKEHGTTPSAVCVKIGYSKATSSYWKQSHRTPKREALDKIADYFGVSVDYLLEKDTASIRESILLGSGEKQNAPTKPSRSELFAILGKLTDSELDEVLDFAEYLLLKRTQAE